MLERGLLLRLRFELDLYINLRPFQAHSSVGAGVPLDFAVVRENTEGTYAGEGGFLRKGTPAEVATQGSVNTRFGVERCIRFAFELAESRRRQLTLVHKTNVLNYSGDLWSRTFNELAAEHPDVETAYNHVDAACMYMVGSPQRYDVIVTDNLFGDILTDLAGAVAGGIGRAASANLNPARTGPSLFEPVHGSAPDIAGTGKANPTAAIISMAMMLEYLGLADEAARINKAVQGFQPAGPLTTTQYGRRDIRKGVNEVPITKTDKIWMDGELINWDDANVHILTHTLHYGLGVFEGIRAYATADGPGVFRLTDHITRLFNSARIFMIDIPFSRDQIVDAVKADGGGKQAPGVLYPAPRLPRLRRNGPEPPAMPRQGGRGGVALGRLPGRRGHRKGRAGEDQLVAAPRPERHASGGQRRRHVHQFVDGQGGGLEGRI